MPQFDADWFRAVLNAMHDMVLVKGPEANLLWANQAFLNYYGMSEAELHQIVDAPHSDPDDTLQYVRDDLTVMTSAAPLDIPQEAVTGAAGDVRYFHTIKSPILEADQVVGTVGLSRLLADTAIPSRAIDHDDAKAFVAPLRALADSFPNPMLMVDTRQRVISASPLWQRQFGDPHIAPDSLFRATYPELTGLHEDLETCLRQNQAVESEIRHAGPDLLPKTFTARICPWAYSDGSIGGATIIATDVSELYEQSAKLKKRNDELMQFSYRASHDLKGPLTTAKGLARFIAQDIREGVQDDALENAEKIVDLMEKLEGNISSFLSLARSDVRGAPDEPVYLSQIVSDICDRLSFQIRMSEVEVSTDLQVQVLFSQKARVGQILENLLSNAVKYADPAKAQHFVKVRSCLSGKGWLQIFVEDNGCGIPPDVGSRVFDMFSRFHEGSEGTGLGLAIVKKHVDALGGHIALRQTEVGTSFCVSLPFEEMEMAC